MFLAAHTMGRRGLFLIGLSGGYQEATALRPPGPDEPAAQRRRGHGNRHGVGVARGAGAPGRGAPLRVAEVVLRVRAHQTDSRGRNPQSRRLRHQS